VKAAHPKVPVIGFPKGAGGFYAGYRRKTGIDGLGLDWTVPLPVAAALQREGAVQGNLDPLRLVAGGRALEDGVGAILKALAGGPLVFNLGHGIVPETPVAHVEAMIGMVRRVAR
jgi:uroporphyrinogen decarboxylase